MRLLHIQCNLLGLGKYRVDMHSTIVRINNTQCSTIRKSAHHRKCMYQCLIYHLDTHNCLQHTCSHYCGSQSHRWRSKCSVRSRSIVLWSSYMGCNTPLSRLHLDCSYNLVLIQELHYQAPHRSMFHAHSTLNLMRRLHILLCW